MRSTTARKLNVVQNGVDLKFHKMLYPQCNLDYLLIVMQDRNTNNVWSYKKKSSILQQSLLIHIMIAYCTPANWVMPETFGPKTVDIVVWSTSSSNYIALLFISDAFVHPALIYLIHKSIRRSSENAWAQFLGRISKKTTVL